MSLDFCLRQLGELITRDYRVPRFAEIKLDDDQRFAPEHLSIKDCVLPLLKDYDLTKKRERYLIECVLYFAGCGCPWTFQDNIKKQEFINELEEHFPNERWPVYYPANRKDDASE